MMHSRQQQQTPIRNLSGYARFPECAPPFKEMHVQRAFYDAHKRYKVTLAVGYLKRRRIEEEVCANQWDDLRKIRTHVKERPIAGCHKGTRGSVPDFHTKEPTEGLSLTLLSPKRSEALDPIQRRSKPNSNEDFSNFRWLCRSLPALWLRQGNTRRRTQRSRARRRTL